MMRCKKNIPFLVIAFIACLIIALYATAYMDATFRKQQLASYNFLYIANEVYKNKLAIKIYGYLIIIIVMAFLYLFISDTKPYKSDQMQITDTILTPVASGQGQCGTAKWLAKKDFGKVFCSYKFDASEWTEWTENNLNDIQEELSKIERMNTEEVKKQVEAISKGDE